MVAASSVVAVVGPTASGKSALALDLAKERGGEIVSCDSLQVYRGLDIGSAKASAQERAAVPHHLLDVVDPDQEFSAADYARLARAAIDDVTGRGGLPIVAGGTGLYLRALRRGLFAGPSRDPDLRRRLEAIADRGGDARLHRMLARVDPDSAARIGANKLQELRGGGWIDVAVKHREPCFEVGDPLQIRTEQQPVFFGSANGKLMLHGRIVELVQQAAFIDVPKAD